MTFLPPIGAISTYLRRLMGYRVLNNCEKFKKKDRYFERNFRQTLKSNEKYE